jgi:hypothetical protein
VSRRREAVRGRRFAVGGWRPSALQTGARPFEGAVDRFDGRVQQVGHLVRMESEDVAQDEDGELARGQDLKGGHKSQRDGFGLLVAGIDTGRGSNWAVGGRPFSRRRGVYIIDGSDDPDAG